MNIIKTFIFLTALIALFLFVGNAMGGSIGMDIAGTVVFWVLLGFNLFFDKIIPALYHAKRVTAKESPELVRTVETLANKAHIPMPKVYIIPTYIPNAFATGRGRTHASVVVTQGILDRLNEKELECILGHELSHVAHGNIFMASMATMLAAVVMVPSDILCFASFNGIDWRRREREHLDLLLVAPFALLAAAVIRLATSRTREYDADKGGAELTGDPLSLASALQKISLENLQAQFPLAQDYPTTAHLFIANPLSAGRVMPLFLTQPPIPERIERLEAMAGTVSPYESPRIIS